MKLVFYIGVFKCLLLFGDIKNYNEKVAENLNNIGLKNYKEPQFVYAHFLIPHQPYFYDSTGNPNPLENLEDEITLRNKEIFLSYLKFCNKQILVFEKHLKQIDPSSIIILMSDHGFRYYNNSKIFEPLNFNNFCAVRNLEVKNISRDSFSNVNFFRYVFNSNFNQNFPFLKDSTCNLNDVKH